MLDGDDVYWLEGRSAERGRRTLHAPHAGRRDPRGHAGPVQRPQPGPRVRRRLVRRGRRAGHRVVVRGRPPVAARPRRPRGARADHASRAVPVRGPAVRPASRRACTPSARRTTRPTRTTPDWSSTSSWRSRSTGPTAPGASSSRGPDFVAAPRPSPDGTTLAWLEWDHPDMPWDAVRLRVAALLEDGSLGSPRTVAGGPGVSIVQPAWTASGVLTFVSDETELVEPVRLRRAGRARRPCPQPRPDGGRAGRPGLGLRPLLVRLPRRMARCWRSRARTDGTASSGSTRTAP